MVLCKRIGINKVFREYRNMTCGIYALRNTINNKRIVGSSVNIEARWSHYKCELRQGKYENDYLQKSWNKYGEDSFIFEIINLCDKDNLKEFEDYYIIAFDTMNRDRGYNLQPADRRKGSFRHSEETKKKMSESKKGKPGHKHTEVHKAYMRMVSTGKRLSVEARQKISNARLGKRNIPIGFRRSEESNRKQSLSMMGKPAWNKGKTNIYSQETIEKIKKGRQVQTLIMQLRKESQFLAQELGVTNEN